MFVNSKFLPIKLFVWFFTVGWVLQVSGFNMYTNGNRVSEWVVAPSALVASVAHDLLLSDD